LGGIRQYARIAASRFRGSPGEIADSRFFYEGGTSMATPLVAGCAAVVRQFLLSQNPKSPSAALVKAMLINGAKPIHGQYAPPEVGASPDNSQGFGRIDLAATVGPYQHGTAVIFKDEATALDTGQSEETRQAVAAGQTLKVTWSGPTRLEMLSRTTSTSSSRPPMVRNSTATLRRA
jgi:hypothetical protein